MLLQLILLTAYLSSYTIAEKKAEKKEAKLHLFGCGACFSCLETGRLSESFQIPPSFRGGRLQGIEAIKKVSLQSLKNFAELIAQRHKNLLILCLPQLCITIHLNI